MNAKQRTHFRKILENLKSELSEEIDRTVHTMQDEATVFADPNDRASQESTWRWSCATATASAS
jgi:DnaK suppressor protein